MERKNAKEAIAYMLDSSLKCWVKPKGTWQMEETENPNWNDETVDFFVAEKLPKLDDMLHEFAKAQNKIDYYYNCCRSKKQINYYYNCPKTDPCRPYYLKDGSKYWFVDMDGIAKTTLFYKSCPDDVKRALNGNAFVSYDDALKFARNW